MLKNLHVFFVLLLLVFSLQAQQTVGLFTHENSSKDSGFVLFAPMASKTTYLIDKCGKLVHTWPSNYFPGLSVYLLEDGSLLRTGQVNNPKFLGGGIIEKIAWDGTIVFSYLFSSPFECMHHDIEPMPNGNFLVILWESKQLGEALEAGRNPNFIETELWPEKIIEVEPIDYLNFNIVWEWHAWDHLVQRYDSTKFNFGLPKDHPELINLNFIRKKSSDMFHFNSIDYNPILDQILISVHTFNEIWIIDHSTTTQEAASHSGGTSEKGGDLLYRWGNPIAYNMGVETDQKLFGQHDAQWINLDFEYGGSIILFNNGRMRPDGDYSSAEIITPPVNSVGEYSSALPYLPEKQSWIYTDPIPANFYSMNISSVQKLDGGNVLICEGSGGRFFEVDTSGNKTWEYINPVSANGIITQKQPVTQNNVFRCNYYPMNYPSFNERKLIGTDPIELNPIDYDCELNIPNNIIEVNELNETHVYADFGKIHIHSSYDIYTIHLINIYGQTVFSGQNIKEINSSYLNSGIYLLKIETPSGKLSIKKLIIS